MAEREGLGRQGRDKEAGSTGHTRGARERRRARHARRKGEGAGADTGHAKAHTEGGARGGKKRQTGVTHRLQSNAMPLTRIEPYRPPRPTIRELMEGRPAGGGRRGNPPEGVPGEAAQVGLPDGGSSAGGETREGARDTALARRGAARRTRGWRGAVRGTGERRATGGGAGRGAERG